MEQKRAHNVGARRSVCNRSFTHWNAPHFIGTFFFWKTFWDAFLLGKLFGTPFFWETFLRHFSFGKLFGTLFGTLSFWETFWDTFLGNFLKQFFGSTTECLQPEFPAQESCSQLLPNPAQLHFQKKRTILHWNHENSPSSN